MTLVCLGLSQTTFGVSHMSSGPENQGLRMQLQIDHTEDANNSDIYKVSVSFHNVTHEDITLVAQWDDEREKGNYGEFVKKETIFEAFPRVAIQSAQTVMPPKRTSPQPTMTVKASESISLAWLTSPRQLKPKGYYNTIPVPFPSDGLYSIRAKFIAISTENKRILLYSNYCQLSVGHSNVLPKFAMASIIQSDPNENKVLLPLGSDQKIQVGDKFITRYFPFANWEITISEVYTSTAVGIVKIISRAEEKNVPTFPKIGWSAELVSK